MRTIPAVAAACLLALTACGSGSDKPAAKSTPSSSASSSPTLIEKTYRPKLEEAVGPDMEAVQACQRPSSNACARYIHDIMAVVDDLEAAMHKAGDQHYVESLGQVDKMKEAQHEYKVNGCQGDPTADDPDSLCHGIAAITIGATTLGVILGTDEIGR